MKASEKIIETWLKNDGWKYNKQDTGQEGGIQYIITLKNKKKLHLFLDGNVGKITLLYLYHLSSEIQGLGESLTLDFLYDLRIDLLLLDVYLKFYSNDKTLKLKSFIFWEENIRNKFLHSLYKMEQVIDLCEMEDNRFVRNYQTDFVE